MYYILKEKETSLSRGDSGFVEDMYYTIKKFETLKQAVGYMLKNNIVGVIIAKEIEDWEVKEGK